MNLRVWEIAIYIRLICGNQNEKDIPHTYLTPDWILRSILPHYTAFNIYTVCLHRKSIYKKYKKTMKKIPLMKIEKIAVVLLSSCEFVFINPYYIIWEKYCLMFLVQGERTTGKIAFFYQSPCFSLYLLLQNWLQLLLASTTTSTMLIFNPVCVVFRLCVFFNYSKLLPSRFSKKPIIGFLEFIEFFNI